MQLRATGHNSEIQEISNAAALRAMANPTRLRILGLLRVQGPQTVGEISTKTGDAPGSISYHLCQLEAVGLVDRQGALDGDRRKSWWKANDSATRPVSPTAPVAPEVSDAADLFRRMTAVTYERTYERYLDALHTMDSKWTEASMCEDQILSLTPQELRQMNDELDSVIHRWSRRKPVNTETPANTVKSARSGKSAPAGKTAQTGKAVAADERQNVAVIMQSFKWVP